MRRRTAASAIATLIAAGSLLAATPAPAAQLTEDQSGKGGPISFGWFESEGFAGAYASLREQNSPRAAAAYLEALSIDPALRPQTIGLDEISVVAARALLADAATTARQPEPGGARPSSTVPSPAPMSVSTAPILGHAANSRYSWRYDDLYTHRYCENWLFPWTCSDSTLSLRFITDPGNRGSRTSLNLLEGGKGRVTSVELRTVVYSGGSNISDSTNLWSTPTSGTQWNSPHIAASGKTFQVWFKMTIRHTKGGPVTGEWKTAKSAKCRTPTSKVAFRCLFPA